MKEQRLSTLAALMCGNPQFRAFIDAESVEAAAVVVRNACGIESRAELDHDAGAAALFHELIRKPFVEWQGQR